MRFSPANCLCTFLLASSSAPSVSARRGNHTIYILSDSSDNSAARVGSALGTLGYHISATTTHLPPPSSSYLHNSKGENTASHSHHAAAALREPNAKVILPSTSTSTSQGCWLHILLNHHHHHHRRRRRRPDSDEDARNATLAVREFFAAHPDRAQRLLELQIDDAQGSSSVGGNAQRQHMQAWEQLCEFLGLGYAVVERLKLRGFPDAPKAGGGQRGVERRLEWWVLEGSRLD